MKIDNFLKTAWFSLSIILVVVAIFIDGALTGDGAYYYGMSQAFYLHGNPAISSAVNDIVNQRVGFRLGSMLMEGRNDALYAIHFWAYSLLNLPSLLFFKLIGFDELKSFQLTNALLISGSSYFVLSRARINIWIRISTCLVFILSTGSIYFQWTHPEIFSTSMAMVAAIAFIDRRFGLALIAASIGSLQNPSLVFFCPVATFAAFVYSRDLVRSRSFILSFFSAALIAFLPFFWSIFNFGVLNPIIQKGYIDYSLMGLERLWSLFFDLNFGVFWGYICLCVTFFAAIFKKLLTRSFFEINDLLIVIVILCAIPVTAQVNWNPGMSVFHRYATWIGMILLIWTFSVLGSSNKWVICFIPAISLQLIFSLQFGGISVSRLLWNNYFSQLAEKVLNIAPSLYNPIPEVFFERVTHQERAIEIPVIYSTGGVITKILDKTGDIEKLSRLVCGEGILIPVDKGVFSQISTYSSEKGYVYTSGRMMCRDKFNPEISFSKRLNNSILYKGWSAVEVDGLWNDGKKSSLIFSNSPNSPYTSMTIDAEIFLPDPQRGQSIHISDGVSEYKYIFQDRFVSITIPVSMVAAEFHIQFDFPDAVSPKESGLSSDGRVLALKLRKISFH